MISIMFIEWPTYYALDPVDSPSFRDFQISERMRLFLSWIFFLSISFVLLQNVGHCLGCDIKQGQFFLGF